MANVTLTWPSADPIERVEKYNIYGDAGLLGSTPSPSFTIPNVVPGSHSFTVAAVNVWGEGPQSDPVLTPPLCAKIINITINITFD